MKKGDDNQQQHSISSAEISESPPTTLWFTDTSIVSSNNGPKYSDIIKMLSHVDLPSPSPIATSSTIVVTEQNLANFNEAQPSGTNKVDEAKGVEHENIQKHGKQRVAPGTHGTKPRHMSRVHERIRALKALVPNCNKRDQASILDDVINYIKSLQMHMQMMQSMGVGAMTQGLYAMNPSIQGPYLAPYYTMRPMGQYDPSYFTSSLPAILPPFTTGFNPSMEAGIGSARMLPIPYNLQFPSLASESTTQSSATIIPTTVSQGRSGTSSHHMTLASQETEQVSATRMQGSPQNLLLAGSQMHDDH